MNHFEYRDGALHCEDVALSEIAAAVGTPVYVYSAATLERHYDVFKAAFAPRDVLVAFAVKANANLGVLATLARKGAGADTVSQGEIERALAAGIPPERIVFSGVGKTADELAFAVKTDVCQINIESEDELRTLARISAELRKPASVVIRVNPDVGGAGGHQKISTGQRDAKFGVSAAQALQLYRDAHVTHKLAVKGLAVHIGSQIKDMAPLKEAFSVVVKLATAIRAAGMPLERLDLGGGLGVPYFNEPPPPAPIAYARTVFEAIDKFDAKLVFEPGRMIAANAGVLVSRVLRIQDRPDRQILVVDAGMNDLIRPAIYDAFHEIKAVTPKVDRVHTYDVVGPICESGDTFARGRMLPPLAGGDLVAFMTAGAYGAAISSTYNTRPLVPEVLVRGDKFQVVRRRWTVAEQMALESLPE